jgi:hypothetical protein
MERTVLEESWRRNGPVDPNLEVIDDDDKELQHRTFVFFEGLVTYIIVRPKWW